MREDDALDRLRNSVMDKLAKHGWTVIHTGMEGDGYFRPFSYTVGLEVTQKHPELLVMGLPPETAQGILNGAVARIKAGEALKAGPDARLVVDYNCHLVAIKPPFLDLLVMEQWVMGGDPYRAWQIVWPDAEGRFPWEPGWDTRWGQVHLGDPE